MSCGHLLPATAARSRAPQCYSVSSAGGGQSPLRGSIPVVLGHPAALATWTAFAVDGLARQSSPRGAPGRQSALRRSCTVAVADSSRVATRRSPALEGAVRSPTSRHRSGQSALWNPRARLLDHPGCMGPHTRSAAGGDSRVAASGGGHGRPPALRHSITRSLDDPGGVAARAVPSSTRARIPTGDYRGRCQRGAEAPRHPQFVPGFGGCSEVRPCRISTPR